MSFAVKVTTAFDNRDINAIAALCHEDMVFVDDYDMHARDDWLAIIGKQIEDIVEFESPGGLKTFEILKVEYL